MLTLANGLPEDLVATRAQAITAGLASYAADGYRLEVGTDELGFSWAHCDLCRDGRGGDRHQAWAVRPPARKEQTMQALIYDDAAWWLVDGDALMVAPIDPASGTPAWDQAQRARADGPPRPQPGPGDPGSADHRRARRRTGGPGARGQHHHPAPRVPGA